MSKNKKNNENQSIRNQRKKIMSDDTDFFVTEEFNTLRTNIMFSSIDSGCKVIGVTSPKVAEGKTIICLNLAISLGKAGENVLIIDGDLRAPKQSKLLEIDGSKGLSNLLVNKVKLADAIRTTDYENVDIMPSGSKPPNPSEMLGSETMKDVVEYLKEYYDYILLDLPPINLVTDAAVASKYLNGLVLVVKSGYTRKEELAESIQRMNNTTSKILGIVLNNKEPSSTGYGKKGKYKDSDYSNYNYTKSNNKKAN